MTFSFHSAPSERLLLLHVRRSLQVQLICWACFADVTKLKVNSIASATALASLL